MHAHLLIVQTYVQNIHSQTHFHMNSQIHTPIQTHAHIHKLLMHTDPHMPTRIYK